MTKEGVHVGVGESGRISTNRKWRKERAEGEEKWRGEKEKGRELSGTAFRSSSEIRLLADPGKVGLTQTSTPSPSLFQLPFPPFDVVAVGMRTMPNLVQTRLPTSFFGNLSLTRLITRA